VEIKFQGINYCRSYDFKDGVAHYDMGSLIYAEIYAVTECMKVNKVGTHAYYECVREND
jgi:hypothetical protein